MYIWLFITRNLNLVLELTYYCIMYFLVLILYSCIFFIQFLNWIKYLSHILKPINYSCSSYPTRASYSGQVDEFRNPMKNELKTRPRLKPVFSNTDANFVNLHIDKATKTRSGEQLRFNHTFYETNFKPKLFTANVECNGTVIKLPKTEKPIRFLNFKFSLNGGDLVFWFTFNLAVDT